jgi:diguanylate cyclase (GGDEF)-like protein
MLPFSVRIEQARDRLVAAAGLLIAVASVAIGAYHLFRPYGAARGRDDVLLMAAGGGLGLLGLGLTTLGRRRRLAAAALAGGLTALSSWLVLGHGFAFEVALAGYVGVLVITVVGSPRTDALVTTALVFLVGLLVYTGGPAGDQAVEGALAIGGLLAATGISLAWLQHHLLSAIAELEVSQARLHRLSHVDALTGLGNRRLFDEGLNRQLRYCSSERPLGMVIIDVDQLKQINDQHGHPEGDKALQMVAEAIRISSRGSDSSARIGGDEFGILLPGGGLRGARLVADRVHELLLEWEDQGKNPTKLTVSIGVAQATDPAEGVQALLASADADMYAARGIPQQAVASR